MIREANHCIYIENQFCKSMISDASRSASHLIADGQCTCGLDCAVPQTPSDLSSISSTRPGLPVENLIGKFVFRSLRI